MKRFVMLLGFLLFFTACAESNTTISPALIVESR